MLVILDKTTKLCQSYVYISTPSYIEQDHEVMQKLCLNVPSYSMSPNHRV